MPGSSIHLLGTGGTVATKSSDLTDTPSADVTELLSVMPGEPAENLRTRSISNVGSNAIGFKLMAELCEYCNDIQSEDPAGVVIVQGTDTIAETAYFLDLALDVEYPIVVTGAMRRYDAVSADGPINLYCSLLWLGHERVSDSGGVTVVMNEEAHAAKNVVKSHTSKVETFESPGYGPLATFYDGTIVFNRWPGSRSISIGTYEVDHTVPVLKTALGQSGEQIDLAVTSGVDGLVIEGDGRGNVTPSMGESLRKAIGDGIPVVLCTKCHEGYAIPKAESHAGCLKVLDREGAIIATDLTANKARVKLLLALEQTTDVGELRKYFRGV